MDFPARTQREEIAAAIEAESDPASTSSARETPLAAKPDA